MNQHDQMREALRRYDEFECKNCDQQLNKAERTIEIFRQALAHVNETPKNEHDSDDVLKRAPLLELNDENIQRDAARFEYLEKFTQCIKTPKGDLAWRFQLQQVLVGDTFGKAIDAAIETEKAKGGV